MKFNFGMKSNFQRRDCQHIWGWNRTTNISLEIQYLCFKISTKDIFGQRIKLSNS